MSKILFSVIIPTHDHPKLLPSVVNSVLWQTNQDFEIIILGDGADRRAYNPIRDQLLNRDPRIRFIFLPKGPRYGEVNRHQAVFQEARGKFIAYLSDTDLWFPNHLEMLAASLVNHDFVHTLAAEATVKNGLVIQVCDLSVPELLRRVKQENYGFDLSNAAHTKSAYDNLPSGWQTTPEGINTDVYMWRQFLAQPGIRLKSILLPTTIHFSNRARADYSDSERLAELKHWSREIIMPDSRRELTNKVLIWITERYARLEAYQVQRGAESNLELNVSRRSAMKKIEELSFDLAFKTTQVHSLEATLVQILQTKGWRILESYRRFRNRLAAPLAKSYLLFSRRAPRINAVDRRIDSATVAVIVPVFNGYQALVKTVYAYLSNTLDPKAALLLVNDCSTDPRTIAFLSQIAEYSKRFNIFVQTTPKRGGFVDSCNLGMKTATSDVVLLNSDTIVTKNWLEPMRVLSKDASVGSISPMSNNATILSLPHINHNNHLPTSLSFLNEVAAQVAKVISKRKMLLPTGHGFCLYLKRSVLKNTGYFDEMFSPGYGEENDLCQKIRLGGLKNVAATGSFVYHQGEVTFTEAGRELKKAHHLLLRQRYPRYAFDVDGFLENDPLRDLRPQLKKTIIAAKRNMTKQLKIGIDAQVLMNSGTTGTARYVRNVIETLVRSKDRDIDSFIITASDEYDSLISKTPHLNKFFAFQTADLLRFGFEKEIDIYHKPQQITSWEELYFFSLCPKKIITYLDLIAYRMPVYFPSSAAHREYQMITRASLEIADLILTISETVKDELVAELNLDPNKIAVTHLGIEHRTFQQPFSKNSIEAWKHKFLVDQPYFVYVGTDFEHKNIIQVVEIFSQLKKSGQFEGKLFLIIKRATDGEYPQIVKTVENLGLKKSVVIITDYISDSELTLFYRKALLYFNLSQAEGFGFTPLEAASAGLASVLSPVPIFRETMGDAAFFPDDGSTQSYVKLVGGLLADRSVIAKMRKKAQARAEQFTWKASTDKLLTHYERLRRLKTKEKKLSRETQQSLLRAKSVSQKRHHL